NDGGLKEPLSERLTVILRQASLFASDTRLASHMGPPPPQDAQADEIAVEDAALDSRCREIVAPKPLDPKFIAELLREGFKREEIPEIDVILSNVLITSSDQWGHVWRADEHDNRAKIGVIGSRSICWRRSPDEQPIVTSYPLVIRTP